MLPMYLPPHTHAQRLYLIRKFAGLGQVEMAKLLGINQSWLSKLEDAQGEIGLKQLQAIRVRFEISADEFLDGMIPYLEISRKWENTDLLPKKYLSRPQVKVLLIQGLVLLYLDRLGSDEVKGILKQLRVPPYVLSEPRLSVNLSLLLDLLEAGLQRGVLIKATDWKELAAHTLDHGFLPAASAQKAPLQVLQSLLDFMNVNEKEFDHVLVKPSQTSARISVPPRAELVQAGRPDIPYGRHLCRYRKEMILKVGKDCVPSKFQLEEVSCQYEQQQAPRTGSEEGCLYHVSWG